MHYYPSVELCRGSAIGEEVSKPGIEVTAKLIWEATSANSFKASYPDLGITLRSLWGQILS